MTTFCEPRPEVAADDGRTQLAIYGAGIEGKSVGPELFDYIFPAIGLPRHKYISINCDTLEAPGNVWRHNMSLPTTLGSCVSMPLKIQAMSAVDELTPQAQAIGSCNTTFFRAEEDGRLTHVGTNTDAAGVSCSLVTALTGISTPFPPSMPLAFAPGTASALMIGGGGATRAAIYALHAMGLSPIYLVNRDAEETAGIVEHFKEWDLRSLETLQAAQEALAQADRDGVKLVAAVGAIPSVEPVTEEEKRVYEIAGTLFGHEYEEGGATLGERYLPLPSKPVHLEMAYTPRMTLIRQLAEAHGWRTVCGIEVVIEQAFEQCYLWTGRVVPTEVREAGRKLVRDG